MSSAAKAASTTIADLAVSLGSSISSEEGLASWRLWAARGFAGLRSIGPYAAIELILPGGSLMALALWLYRRYYRTRRIAIGTPAEAT